MSDFPWNFIATVIICGIVAIIAGKDGFKSGYIQALEDAKKNKPAKYVLEEQDNGETKWIENKEKK